jgi:hypothetical protein
MTIIREWKGKDGHTYCELSDGSIGHLNCWCFNKSKK